MTNRPREWFVLAVVVVVGVFVLLMFAQADKRFVLDAVDFPVLAKAISETGLPYHYRGETDPSSLGLWHPPLYAYGLAAFIKIFGFSENIVRAFGICCTLISAFLCILIYKTLFKIRAGEKYLFSIIFLTLFLWHPYTIANATVPDIDSTVLPVAILIFLYYLVNFPNSDNSLEAKWPFKSVLILAVFFAISLWTKLTTPLVLVPVAFFVIYIRGWSLGKSTSMSMTVATVGGVIFVATYWLYCFLLGLPFDFVFRFLLFSFTKNASSGGGLSVFLDGVIGHLSYARQFANAIGLTSIFAIILAIGSLLFHKNRTKSDSIVLVFAGMAAFVTLFYLSLTGAFGGFFKYPYAVFPLLILVLARYLAHALSVMPSHGGWLTSRFGDALSPVNMDRARIVLAAGVGVVVCCFQAPVVRDAITYQDQPVAHSMMLLIPISALLLAGLSVGKSAELFMRYGLSALLTMMVVSQFWISRSQAVVPYPTTYHFGQMGLDETVSYLKNEARPNETIWAMKDVGHYSGLKYIENYALLFKPLSDMDQGIGKLIEVNKMRYFVVTKNIGQDRIDAYSDLKTALETCCSVHREFGNFVIYKAKQHE